VVGVRVLSRLLGVTATVSALLAAGLAAPAAGQLPTVDVKPQFDLKLGKRVARTSARNATLTGSIGHTLAAYSDKPSIVSGGSLLLPRGLTFHGGSFPTCGRRLMLDEFGVDRCSERSIVGRPKSTARAFDGASAVVDGFTDADYVFVNGGPRRIFAFTTIFAPAIVQEPVKFDLRKRQGRKWSYRVDFRFPEILRIVAGIPVVLRSVDVALDGIGQAPGYVTFDRRCPKRGYLVYRARLTFLHGDGTTTESGRRGRLICRR